MVSEPSRPARRAPAAEWWVPLLVDLAAIQRGSISLGFCVDRIDLAGETPRVTASWPTGASTTLRPDPEAGREALLEMLAATGEVAPPPADHGHVFWQPDEDSPPRLRYAWILEDLGRCNDAWYAYLPNRPVGLLQVSTDGSEVADVAVLRRHRGDIVIVGVTLRNRSPDEDIGMGYGIVEDAVFAEDRSSLEPVEPLHGLPTYRGPLFGSGQLP